MSEENDYWTMFEGTYHWSKGRSAEIVNISGIFFWTAARKALESWLKLEHRKLERKTLEVQGTIESRLYLFHEQFSSTTFHDNIIQKKPSDNKHSWKHKLDKDRRGKGPKIIIFPNAIFLRKLAKRPILFKINKRLIKKANDKHLQSNGYRLIQWHFIRSYRNLTIHAKNPKLHQINLWWAI